jgi:hypothetical protein
MNPNMMFENAKMSIDMIFDDLLQTLKPKLDKYLYDKLCNVLETS